MLRAGVNNRSWPRYVKIRRDCLGIGMGLCSVVAASAFTIMAQLCIVKIGRYEAGPARGLCDFFSN